MSIEKAVKSEDVENIQLALVEAGVECSVRQNGKLLEVPGYGQIFWDDQPGVEPGWVVRDHHQTGADEPVDSDELTKTLSTSRI